MIRFSNALFLFNVLISPVVSQVGPTGRGCAEYTGVDTRDIDIMMGTFTKSFAGMGGYIAADKSIIDHLRKRCSGSAFHTSMSPVVCQQVLTAFEVRPRDGGFSSFLYCDSCWLPSSLTIVGIFVPVFR